MITSELFDYFSENHNLTLTDQEIEGILNLVRRHVIGTSSKVQTDKIIQTVSSELDIPMSTIKKQLNQSNFKYISTK